MNYGIRYARQKLMYDPEKNKDRHAVIIGAGAGGSYLTLFLANLGVRNITVYDFDEVEEHNVPNQLYGVEDIGKPKVEALKDIVMRLTGIEINAVNEKVEEFTMLPGGEPVIYIMAVDSFEARQTILDILKLFDNWIMDLRMGGEEWAIYTFKPSNEDMLKEVESTLTRKGAELPCGMQSIIDVLLDEVARATNNFRRICTGAEVPEIIKKNVAMCTEINSMVAERQEKLRKLSETEEDEDGEDIPTEGP